MPLKDQVVLVTGCSSGIGRALVVELASRGHRVFASARRPESLEGLEGVEKLSLDVTDERSVESAIAEIVASAGRVDVLVNNAGVNAVGPLAELPMTDVRRLFETNVVGLLAVTQAVFPHMAERGHGRIVNIGSVVGLLPTPFAGAYCATKSAVHMLSDVLRVELAPFGVDVMLVQPGRVRSSITENASVGLERFAAETSKFHAVFDHIVKRARASQVDPMETSDFAHEVAMAMMADAPPRLLRAGGGAGSYAALSQLPRGLLDRVMTQRFGLAALRGPR